MFNEEHFKKYDKFIETLPDGGKEVTLSGGEKVVMREPTVQDQITASNMGSAAENEITFIANLSMKTPAEIKGMKLKDYSRLQAALNHFLF